MQMVSKRYARLYNGLGPPKGVDFLQAFVIEVDRGGETLTFAVERAMEEEGAFVKYNNNSGFVEFGEAEGDHVAGGEANGGSEAEGGGGEAEGGGGKAEGHGAWAEAWQEVRRRERMLRSATNRLRNPLAVLGFTQWRQSWEAAEAAKAAVAAALANRDAATKRGAQMAADAATGGAWADAVAAASAASLDPALGLVLSKLEALLAREVYDPTGWAAEEEGAARILAATTKGSRFAARAAEAGAATAAAAATTRVGTVTHAAAVAGFRTTASHWAPRVVTRESKAGVL